MSNENKSEEMPWAAAPKVGPSTDYIGLKAIIHEACERHASDLRAENERLAARVEQLRASIEDYHKCRTILEYNNMLSAARADAPPPAVVPK